MSIASENNVDANKTWQLSALTEALGDLIIEVNDSLSVGRGQDNDVVLGSKQISRQHAQLNVINGQLYVKDLGSANGTFINDVQLEANKYKHAKVGDTLRFASFAFAVQSDSIQTQQTHDIADADVKTETIDTANTPPDEIQSSDDMHTPVPSTTSSSIEDIQVFEPTENLADSSLKKATDTAQETNMDHEKTKVTETQEEPVWGQIEPDTNPNDKTELQKEANPEVLEAKQAATGQLSATNNLGNNVTADMSPAEKKSTNTVGIIIMIAILIAIIIGIFMLMK